MSARDANFYARQRPESYLRQGCFVPKSHSQMPCEETSHHSKSTLGGITSMVSNMARSYAISIPGRFNSGLRTKAFISYIHQAYQRLKN